MNRKANILQSVQTLRALAVMIVMLFTANTAWAQQVPWSGLGTKDNPYVIKTTQELDELARRVNNHPTGDPDAENLPRRRRCDR